MPASATKQPNLTPVPASMLLFYAPDDARMRRLADKLQPLAKLRWENSRTIAPPQLVQQAQAYRLVLLDYSAGSAAHSTELARQLAVLAPDWPLVAIGSTAADQTAGVLAALRAGVRDFIDIDAPAEEIQSLLRRALAQANGSRSALASVPVHKGRLVLMLGARAGVGTSTLAAHLAVLTQQASADNDEELASNQLLLLGLGRPAGDLGLYLSAESNFHYEDALRNANRFDGTLARTALTRHNSGFALLDQPVSTAEPPAGGGESAVLLDRLRGVFGLLLCDAGGLSGLQVPLPLLKQADEIWVVADQGIGTLVSLDKLLKELEQSGVRDGRLKLIVNRHDEASGISPQQIASRFNLPLLASLPDRSRALRSSASVGKLLHEHTPRDPYLRGLAPLLARLAPDTRSSVGTAPWQRLAHRLSSLRWKKM